MKHHKRDVTNIGNGERGTGNRERGTGHGARGTGNDQTIFREIEQDNCFIIQQIDNKTRNILKSFCRHFFTSLFLPTYEATYIAGYTLPTDDRYREHHDHIWIVLQFVE